MRGGDDDRTTAAAADIATGWQSFHWDKSRDANVQARTSPETEAMLSHEIRDRLAASVVNVVRSPPALEASTMHWRLISGNFARSRAWLSHDKKTTY